MFPPSASYPERSSNGCERQYSKSSCGGRREGRSSPGPKEICLELPPGVWAAGCAVELLPDVRRPKSVSRSSEALRRTVNVTTPTPAPPTQEFPVKDAGQLE
ncbi:hypothetical protein CapIbe_016075 [Capra ibex]